MQQAIMHFIKIFFVCAFAVSTNAETYAAASPELPAQEYEAPAPQPAKSFTSYEAPAPAPSVEYGAPEIEYEVVQPEIKYGPPPKQEVKYEPPTQPETKYGPPPQPEVKYGPPPQPEIKYGPPAQPQNKYGPPPAPQARYGAPRRVVKVAPVTVEYRPYFVTVRRPVLRYKLRINTVPTISFPARSYGFPVGPFRSYGAFTF